MDSGLDARSSIDHACLGLSAPPNSKLLMAVSGGADSVALLRSLVRVAPRNAWRLRVCHVNHGLRGEESDADEAFVRQLAESLSLQMDVRRVAVLEHARTHRQSTETAARELRYEALLTALGEWDGDALVTAHTKNDQAETLLLHLLRGAGLRGLGGMRSARAQILRPLLDIDRQTVILALQADNQGYRLDSSNSDDEHARNRVRNHVIPTLQHVQPDPIEVLARSARLLQDDADLLAAETRVALERLCLEASDAEVTLPRAALLALHPSLVRSLLRAAVERVRGNLQDVTEQHIASIQIALESDAAVEIRRPEAAPTPLGDLLQTRGAGLTLPAGIKVVWEKDCIRLSREAPASQRLVDVQFSVPGQVVLPTGTLSAEVFEEATRAETERLIVVCGPYHALVDTETVKEGLTAGPRRKGDRFRPLGMNGTKKLQDLFVDRSVPQSERDRKVIVRNANHIVWIPGEGLDHRAAVRPSTTRLAHLSFLPKT
jgi:tRNA(Ile)-lysidine synthase